MPDISEQLARREIDAHLIPYDVTITRQSRGVVTQTNLQRATRRRQSIVQKAFSGDITPRP